MKYSKRELKAFNVFSLFLFGLGGLFFAYGAIEYVVQPTLRYSVVLTEPKTKAIEKPSMEDAPPATPATTHRRNQETRIVKGTNLKAVRNMLVGAVFLVLSFALNAVLLRVMRRGGRER